MYTMIFNNMSTQAYLNSLDDGTMKQPNSMAFVLIKHLYFGAKSEYVGLLFII